MVSKGGTGSGAVASNPAGISCGSTCSAPFPEKSGRTDQRGQETRLARDEPEVDSVADQLGSTLYTQCSHHVVFVGFDGARGELQDCGNLLHPSALRDEPQHLALP